MASKPKFTVEQCEQAITATRGNILAAAANLKCSRKAVYDKIKKYPKLQIVVDSQREEMLDFAEAKLYQQIRNDNLTAIIFFLKTQGRGRGYSSRLELEGAADGNPINIADRRNVTINLVGGMNGQNAGHETGTDPDNRSDPVLEKNAENAP